MYEELVKKIRHCATDPMHCLSCGEDKDDRCFKRLMTQAADAIEQLSNAGSAYGSGWTLGYDAGREGSKPRWISVTERLPEEAGKYLVCGRWGGKQTEIWVCEFMTLGYMKGWANNAANPVVSHWQPLPEPPKEDGE